MTIYPVEFHRRLERNWARRIDDIPPSRATRHRREIPTMMKTRTKKTKRRKGRTSRWSSENPNPTNSKQATTWACAPQASTCKKPATRARL
jgi:hypothetical protein